MSIEHILDKLFKCRVIVNCDRNPYLLRWYVIRTKWIGLFIHKFIRSDEDRALHDHPWNFLVIPIWRGYREWSSHPCPYVWPCIHCCGSSLKKGECTLETARRVYPILGTRFRHAIYRHRVQLMPCKRLFVNMLTYQGCQKDCPHCNGMKELPSWSIFIRFRKLREWGFWEPGGFKHWQDWWKEKCE